MSDLLVDAELDKLARTLGCTRADLEGLGLDDTATIRSVARAARRHLISAQSKRLAGVVAASKLLPPKIAGAVAEHHFGPVLCAASLGLVDAAYAGKVARHLSMEFMADITSASDPELAARLAPGLSRKVTVGIATTLVTRRDDVTLASFVGPLDADAVAEILVGVSDHGAVVRIALLVEDTSMLDQIVRQLPDDHLVGIIEAIRDHDLWPEGLSLVGHLQPDQHARVGHVASTLADDVLVGAVRAATEHELWDGLLGLVGNLDRDALARFAEIDEVISTEVLTAMARAATASGLVGDMLSLIDLLPARRYPALADAIASLDDADIDTLVDAAIDAHQWSELVGIAAEVDDTLRGRIAAVAVDRRSPADLARLVERAVEAGGEELAALGLDALDDAVLAEVISHLGPDRTTIDRIIASGAAPGLATRVD